MPITYRKSDVFDYSDDKDLLKIIGEDFARSVVKYGTLKESMKEDIKRYWLLPNTIPPTVSQKGAANPVTVSNLKLPTARSHVETYLSILMANSFPEHAEWLKAEPSPEAQAIVDKSVQLFNIAEIYRQFRLLQLGSDRMDFFRKCRQYLLQGLLTYWTVSYLRWHRQGGWVYVGDEESEDRKFKDSVKNYAKQTPYNPNHGHEYREVVEDRASFEIIDTLNGFPDPLGGANWDKNVFFGDETRVSWHELYANEWNPKANNGVGLGLYINLKELWDRCKDDGSTPTPQEELENEADGTSDSGVTIDEEHEKENQFRNSIKIRRYWTKHGVITTDANHVVVIAKERYADWRNILFKWQWGDERTFAAQSLLRLLTPLDMEIDAIVNQALGNLTRINDAIQVTASGLVPVESRGKPALPGMNIDIDGDDARKAVAFHRPPDIAYSTFQMLDTIYRQLEGVSGLGVNTLSQYFAGGQRKATETEYVNQGGANRQGQTLLTIERSFLNPFLNAMTLLEVQKFQMDVPFNVKTDDGVALEIITREWIRQYGRLIRFTSFGSMLVNQRSMEASGFQSAYQLLSGNPATAQIIDWTWMVREVLKRVGFVTDPDEALSAEMQDKVSIPPEQELILMRMGMTLSPHINDDHNEHIEAHTIQLEEERTQQSLRGSAMRSLPNGGVDDGLIQRIEQHLQETEQALAAEQTTNPTGAGAPGNGMVTPGQLNSQNTQGTQMANLTNPQAGASSGQERTVA